MKRIYCASGDGTYILVPDEVKAVVDLLKLYVWVEKNSGGYGYIDVSESSGDDGVDSKIDLDMYYHTEISKARALFIEWVRNGCVERRVGYD